MFVIKGDGMVPIKIWLGSQDDIEPGCLEQAKHIASLPFAFHHVALMPDCHQGFGMPIGGVLAAEDVVVPNAVGVDIGCGISFAGVDVPARLLREVKTPHGTLGEYIVRLILERVPTGFEHHKEAQESFCLSSLRQRIDYRTVRGDFFHAAESLASDIESAYYQVGTLGGGNHFIELQEDDDGNLAIMLHSGSRNLGYKVAKHFDALAKHFCKVYYSAVPSEWGLAFLPMELPLGQAYVEWMDACLLFARENRTAMMERIKDIVLDSFSKYASVYDIEFSFLLDVHHNYVACEQHFGRHVWVHRKGAIHAPEGKYVIVPGAMGSKSYIVRGRGESESFSSCSHGAGRRMGRKDAARTFPVGDVMRDLEASGVVVGKCDLSDIAEECRAAYKDVDEVIANEEDLVEVVKTLRTVCVIKG